MKLTEENNGDPQKCVWCGESVTSDTWSEYCSFRCTAAGRYRMFVLLSVISPIILVIMLFVLVMMGLDSWTYLLIRPSLIFPLVMMAGISIFFVYGTIVGKRMRNAKLS
jgi:uncharacterized integral membrane protein